MIAGVLLTHCSRNLDIDRRERFLGAPEVKFLPSHLPSAV